MRVYIDRNDLTISYLDQQGETIKMFEFKTLNDLESYINTKDPKFILRII